jgi:hypothetical protein
MGEGCAARSRARAEPPRGTASRARRWLLVEQPGAWGSDALERSDLPPEVTAHLRRLAATLPARVLLLRRPGGETRPGTARTVYAGESTAAGGWLERFELDHVDELLELDLGGLSSPPGEAPRTVGGDRVLDPLYLVCTNGKHDPCCAEFGLPVARELAEVVGDRLWECSHVGGDRFAGNLVCLPEGHFYGHLDPETARSVVAAHEGGRIVLDHWRGRSSLPFAAQAAEALVRRELGLDREAALRVERVTGRGATHEVRLVRPDGPGLTAVVTTDRGGPARALTCAGGPSVPPRFHLTALETSGS